MMKPKGKSKQMPRPTLADVRNRNVFSLAHKGAFTIFWPLTDPLLMGCSGPKKPTKARNPFLHLRGLCAVASAIRQCPIPQNHRDLRSVVMLITSLNQQISYPAS